MKIDFSMPLTNNLNGDELIVKFSFGWVQQENAISSGRKFGGKSRNPNRFEHVIGHKLDSAI